MATRYQICFYVKDRNEDGDYQLVRNIRRIGKTTREWKRARKIVYWLRRRGVMAFAF
jgi:hypothetical protein